MGQLPKFSPDILLEISSEQHQPLPCTFFTKLPDFIKGDGLGLDSIDALELIVILDRFYGIKLANPAEGKAIFKNVATIADYVAKNRTK